MLLPVSKSLDVERGVYTVHDANGKLIGDFPGTKDNSVEVDFVVDVLNHFRRDV